MQVRDFLHVEDVAEAFVAILDSGLGGAINVASGRPVAIREVVRIIGNKMGRSDLLALGALSMREGDPPLLVADVRRLNDELNWKPRYDLGDGLEQTIGWWKTILLRGNDARR
jgi:nucleoside-diphosphate-sugar epimerase